MQVLAICLGLLSCIYLSECAFTEWTAPVLAVGTGNTAGNGNAGVVYLNEGATAVQTVSASVDANAVASYAIETQTVTDFFTITSPEGVITVASSGVLDGAATTTSHVLTIKAVDGTTGTALSATVTVTYSIIAGQFTTGYSCTYYGPEVATGVVFTNGMNSGGTNVISIESGNTNTDFTIDSGTGAVSAANALTPASGTSGSYTLVIKGVESIGTASTVTSTISICMRGSTCVCAIPSSSAAAHITAGLLGIFAALIMMLLK